MPTRAEFMAEARTWAGVPWRHQGRDRHGLDCAGLVEVTAWALGVSDVHTTGYTKRPKSPGEFVGHFLAAGCRLKSHADVQLADVLVMRLDRYPFHCGLYAGDGRILHAYAVHPWRCVVEMPFQGDLLRGWTHCLAIPGLSD